MGNKWAPCLEELRKYVSEGDVLDSLGIRIY